MWPGTCSSERGRNAEVVIVRIWLNSLYPKPLGTLPKWILWNAQSYDATAPALRSTGQYCSLSNVEQIASLGLSDNQGIGRVYSAYQQTQPWRMARCSVWRTVLRPRKCNFCPPIAVCVRETSSGPCRLRVGWKKSFYPVSSCAPEFASCATSAGICRFFNDGLPSQIRGGETSDAAGGLSFLHDRN